MHKIIRFYKQFLTSFRKHFIEAILFNFFILVLSLPLPYFTKLYIDKVYPDKNYQLLWFIVIFTFCFQVFQSIIQFLYQMFTTFLLNHISVEIKLHFYHWLQKLEVLELNRQKTGDLVSRMNEGPGAVTQLFNIFNRSILNVTYILVIPFILISIHLKLFIIAILTFPVHTLLYYYLNRKIKVLQKKSAEEYAALNASNIESITGIKNIQLLGQYDIFSTRLKDQMVAAHQSGIHVQIFSGWISIASSSVRFFAMALFNLLGWAFILKNEMTMGTFFAFSGYLGFLLQPIHELFSSTTQLQQILVAIERFFEIYSLKTIRNNGTRKINQINHPIRFEKVEFSYFTRRAIFNDLNFEIEMGKHLAIIGESGVGKTTLAGLIIKSFDPQAGTIWYDDYRANEIDIDSIRQLVGFFSQDSYLFNGTLKQNITCFHEKYDLFKIEKILSTLLLNEFVNGLPNGLDTDIGEGGSLLSKGLKQRFLLARFLYFEKPIMIFDEMTNSLDIQTENTILKILKKIITTGH